MKAITLWPEWAWAICNLGKDVENRTWKPPRTLGIGDRFCIHAGQSIGGENTTNRDRIRNSMENMIEISSKSNWQGSSDGHSISMKNNEKQISIRKKINNINKGFIVAVVTLEDILVPGYADPSKNLWWAGGVYGWKLSGVKVLPLPVRCMGKQGLWDVETNVITKVLRTLGEER